MNKPWYQRWYNIASIVFVAFCLLLLATLGLDTVEMPTNTSSSQRQTEESTLIHEADGVIVDPAESDDTLEGIEEEVSTNETVDVPVVQQHYEQSEQNYQQEVPVQRNSSQSSQPSSQAQPTEDSRLPLKATCEDGTIQYQDDPSGPNYRGMCSHHGGIAKKHGRVP